MSRTIGQFTYEVTKMGKDDIALNPWVQLTLKSWGTTEKSKAPLVSPHLMTDAEIDGHIADLKADLDAVGRSAKAALHKAQDSTKALVIGRIGGPV